MKIVLLKESKMILLCFTVMFFLLVPFLVILISVEESGERPHVLHKQASSQEEKVDDTEDRLKFQKFVAEYNRDYGSDPKEHAKRFGIFQESLRYVEKMNSYNLSYQLGVTMFSDLTDEEFIDQYASKFGNVNKSSPQQPVTEANQLLQERRQLGSSFLDNNTDPRYKKEFQKMKYRDGHGQQRYIESEDDTNGMGMDIGDYDFIDNKLIHCPIVDWVKQGKVLHKVKNQKKCGSCWAHNTVASLENLYARYNDIDDPRAIPSFSEQQLVDCNTFPNIGCFGGEAKYAFNYTKNNGITGSQFYQYMNKQEECRFNPKDDLYDDYGEKMPETPVLFKIDNFKVYNHVTTRDLEKLTCEGAVAVPFRISKCIKHYISGIIDDRDGLCGCSQFGGPNHAVTLVGFGQINPMIDEEYQTGWTQAEGTSGTKCQKYWLLRNSWSNRWGEGGYFRLCREDVGLRDGTCFIRHDAVLPIMNKRYVYSRE